MDFDLNWVLLGLPVAFVLGWLASRLDLRQLRIEDRAAPKAYFRGLNFLLNEQQDQAIDAFIEAVQNDPDTSELHFALGNLFRRRGEYERAVRVHEHLLSRGDLGQAERERAQHALALDFLKAGLLDRAEDALRKLEGTPFQSEARLARLAIYERTRDWPAATDIARKLQASGDISFANRMAHYLCEQAAAANGTEADKLLKEAIALAPTAPRAHLALAVAQARAGHPALAFNTLLANVNTAQAAIPLIAKELAIQAKACDPEPTTPASGTPNTCSASPRWWPPPAGWQTPRSQEAPVPKRSPRTYNARWTMLCALCCATAARPAASRPNSISGNVRGARRGTAIRPDASKSCRNDAAPETAPGRPAPPPEAQAPCCRPGLRGQAWSRGAQPPECAISGPANPIPQWP